MNTVQILSQFEHASIYWDCQLSLGKKLDILRTIFGGTLDNVNFWDLYKVVKKLQSQ
ncbi:MAG: hypothetical protein HWN66_06630 [Candidatus Helarchaeota archaeon]|nr:hypothetical protein [Candidatus Helarchaeota archaeon]